jgi:predicted signal transduction protein with EAL and GGDEF domain
VAAKLQEASQRPYQIEHHELTIAPSMGIALHPQDGTEFDALTQAADVAMYHAKLDGRNTYRFFTPEMRAKSLRALQLENALRRAWSASSSSCITSPRCACAPAPFAAQKRCCAGTTLNWAPFPRRNSFP